MTPHQGNTILFRSSQQLPRLRLGPLKGRDTIMYGHPQTQHQGLCQFFMVSLFLCSSGSNARGKSRAFEGHRVSSKSRLRVRDRENGRE